MIYPVFIMVLLTLVIGVIAFFTRVNSVKSHQIKPQAYKLMNAESYPESVIKTTRCFNNQFEVPVLFYVGCLSYLILNVSSNIGLYFAWAFVSLRVVHAYIHLTYNHLLHRIIAFWSAIFMVIGLWLVLMLEMM
jgi:hypothetical protein